MSATLIQHPLSLARRLHYCGFAILGLWLAIEAICGAYLWWDDFSFRSPEIQAHFVDSPPNNLVRHNHRIWANVPGSRYKMTSTSEQRTIDVQINEHGFRDESPDERSDDIAPFVALGDSFTFGWLVEKKERWDEQLAEIWRQEAGGQVDSCNLGMWMTTFDQHALALEERLPPRCSGVIHLIYPSHVQTIARHQVQFEEQRIVSIHDPLLHVQEGRLLFGATKDLAVSKNLTFPFTECLVKHHLGRIRLRGIGADSSAVKVVEEREIYVPTDPELLAAGWRLTAQSIQQISRLLASRKIPYLVAIVPRDRQVSRDEWGDEKVDDAYFNSTVAQDRIEKIVQDTGWAQFLDLTPLMRASTDNRFYLNRDPHWNVAGHRFAATEIWRRWARDHLARNLISARR